MNVTLLKYISEKKRRGKNLFLTKISFDFHMGHETLQIKEHCRSWHTIASTFDIRRNYENKKRRRYL
jgi:hypothetical protein